MARFGERGFTLVELLVVGTLLTGASLYCIFFLLAPIDRTAENLAAERRTEIAYIAQGIQRYTAATGQLPPNVPGKLTAIGSYDDHYNLCTSLVPEYLEDMPLDPAGGSKLTSETSDSTGCNAAGIKYATGYAIAKMDDGRIMLTAPFAEVEAMPEISITIKPLTGAQTTY